tara:strand:- start:147 stop:317 length:171 start_codon:yes stop_codon:yes gene_type:complete
MGMHFLNGSIMEVKMKELSIKDQKSLSGGNQDLDPWFQPFPFPFNCIVKLLGISAR